MMKRYILAALTLIALTGNALAQKDITKQYITNATLASGTTGWAVTNFNSPQQGNNTVGYASEAYAGWNNLEKTTYSMTQNITLPAGNYRLVNYSFFRQGLRYNTDASKSLAYLKAGSQQVPIKTLGSISGIPTNGDNGGYANSQAEGANCFDSKMYRNMLEFTIDANNTTIEIGIVGTFDLKQSWCIAGMFELFDLDDAASVSSPTDVTYAITNPGFEYRNLTGWTTNGIAYQDNEWSDKTGLGFMEKWQWNAGLPNASITQELTGLQNGLYELSVYAHNINQRNGDAPSTGLFLTANDKQTEIGAYGQYKVRATITDGTLTIGLKLDNCTGNWIAADRFELQFYGDPDAALRDLLSGYITEAESLLTSQDATMLTDEQKGAVQQAINQANAATSANLSDNVDGMANAIQTARQQIQTVKDNRALMLAALERFENEYNLVDGTDYSRVTMSADAWATLLTKVNAVSTALDDVSQAANYGTLKDELIAQMNATDASLRLFKKYKVMAEGTVSVLNGSPTELAPNSDTDTDASETAAITRLNTTFVHYALAQDAPINMAAFLGENLDFSAAQGSALNTDNSNGIYAIAGWEVNYADADTWAVLQNQHNEHQGQLYIRKNWGSAATTLTVAKEKMLPEGKYTLSFSWNSNMANMTNFSQYVLGGTAITIGEATTYEFEVVGEPKTFDLIFGFQKKNEGNTPAQLIVDDVVLTYTQSSIELADNADNATTITENVGKTCNVKLDGRTFFKDDKWNTLCLPFGMTTFSGSPLETATVMELDTEGQYDSTGNLNEDGAYQTGLDTDNNTLYLFFKETQSIEAGKPYLVKWSADDNLVSPVFRGVTISDAAQQTITSSDSKVSFKGIYSPTPLAKDKSDLYIGNDNTLYWPNTEGDFNLNSFRAYFYIGSTVGAKLRSNVLLMDDDATGINDVTTNPKTHGESWYTLDGRKLNGKPTVKGMYIKSGRKVVIK